MDGEYVNPQTFMGASASRCRASTMPSELLSYLAGILTAVAGVGLIGLLRRSRRAARARTREQQRRQAARARHDRHEAQKARVRFVPSQKSEADR